ncbi:glycosyl transferase [Enterococcus florum]|uniref:Glycosyl transferase n=1 Tax=Enterococcus florum TaxID=2480627 RepID=A0A4P5PAM2_9ENTE|nr:glycosyltransferase [Enterococcus florum]GCF93301.1 glycosyl transferase [Enterococcus florum]
MNEILFVTNIEMKKTSGIYKKIVSQCKALSRMKKCTLICKKDGKIFNVIFYKGQWFKEISTNKPGNIRELLKHSKEMIESLPIEILYFRLTLKPTFRQVKLFKFARENGIKVIYEIPTFPFFFEQVNSSNRKLLTLLKMIFDKIIFLQSKRYIDCIPVILSNSEIKKEKKFFEITNGVCSNNLPINYKRNSLNDSINFLGVGTLISYHGYDKLIKSIYQYKQKENKIKIIFHIVGDGPEIGMLKRLALSLDLTNEIKFYGPLHGEELNKVFEIADAGIGALSLYKRHADIDTTLKVVEYLVRGIPVITSGHLNEKVNKDFYIEVENDSSVFDLRKVLEFLREFRSKDRDCEITFLRDLYNWDNIMEKIVNGNEFNQ